MAFLGIGLGSMLAIVSEPLLRRVINLHKINPENGKRPLESSIIAVCLASILSPLGQFWFAWTSTPATIHWIWPILAGIPFGAGNCLSLIYASGYLVNSYGIYAASAIASTQVSRNVMAGLLPLAGTPMYHRFGTKMGGTFLGLIQIALIPIPFIFYNFGGKIRAKSSVISRIQKDQERIEMKAAIKETIASNKKEAPV
ncbi:hypothetical protein K3495_g8785 [Podosphaera aphanis]|nr:hypothetical protein K3495_g8785 [Podosphaera aphanis]